ncbi:MAG: 4-(cytidine 5'-diphospho)-2-C-methyl-D-erythritol kinase [Actinobacteria bacterium]|uniref:4-(cytidine 5'-diphospho)-2-C-methyl-D-erythritol kinase n=1 Tax=freshwater metagenome TaxID=449393 RepID=A0A6J6I2Q5_9ZZZZ|nr:4-(cytidine 5'-diphospho)-2-C-methyl-D-erythritol kinase [Actinomycetota bacterium]
MIHSTASAPGKINIFFAVGPLLKDGYHEVVSIYQALDIRETVSVSASTEWSVSVTGILSADQLAAVPTGEDNLVVKAAKQIAEISGITERQKLNFEISKNVPVAGGMGGGSADAAAALLAVNKFWGTELDQAQLLAAAASLGADIPFAILGGTAVGTGRGENLSAVAEVKTLHWVLVANSNGLSTPRVYARLDELRKDRGEDPSDVSTPLVPAALIYALQSGDAIQVAKHLHNDLQEAAVDLMPELLETMNQGLEAGALAAMVSGSGPTIALLASDEGSANQIANRLAIQGHYAIATFGPAIGTVLESI